MRLVGRDSELSDLDTWWQRVQRRGRGATVWVSGAAGIGKTALIRHWVARVEESGTPVLSARADEFCIGVLDPIRWAVQTAAVDPSNTAALDLRDRILGALRSPSPAAAAPETSIAVLLLEFLDATAGWAGRNKPAVLVLEDLHAADPETLRLVAQLARTDSPHLLLLTSRPYQVSGSVRMDEVVSRLVESDLGYSLTLHPLEASEVAELVEVWGGDPAQAEQLVEATQGNPLLVRLWLQSHPDAQPDAQGPPADGIDQWHRELLRRFVTPGSPAAEVGARLALLGRFAGDRTPLLAALLDRAESDVVEAIELLLGQGVVEKTPHGLDFAHPLMREAFAALLTREEARTVHLRMADLLHDDRPEPDPETGLEIASHLMAAGPLDSADQVQELYRAAEKTMWVSPGPAAAWFGRVAASANADPDLRNQAFTGQVAALLYAGESGRGRDLCRQALQLFGPGQAPAELIETSVVICFSTGNFHELITLVREAPAEHLTLGSRAMAATVLAMLLRPDEALELYEPMVAEMLDPSTDLIGSEAALVSAIGAAVILGRVSEAVLIRERARDLVPLSDPIVREMLLAGIDMQVDYLPTRPDDVLVDHGPRTNPVSIGGGREVNRSLQHYLRGRWDTLLEEAPALIEILRGTTNLNALSMPAACTALVLTERERWDDAEHYAQQAIWPLESYHGQLVTVAVARIEAARGQREAALARLEEVAGWGRQGLTLLHTMITDQWALLLEEQGETGYAAEIAQEGLARVAGDGVPLQDAFGRLSVARTTGDVELAHAALDAARLAEVPILEARCERLLATLGDRPPERLTRAHALSRQVGSVTERIRVEQVMRERGIATPRGRGSAESLTSVESAVVRSLMDGMTNRQIAEYLRCSPKTIEMHLSRVYARTGHAGRVELARAVSSGELALEDS